MLKSFDDGRVFGHFRAGTGPLCVLLHGWARDSSDLAPLAALLEEKGLPTLRLDLPGFGASPPPDSPWDSADYAAAVCRVIAEASGRQSGADTVVVVGHSFGGRVALQIAAMSPCPAAAVVVTGVPLFRRRSGAKPPIAYRMARWASRRGLLGEARMEEFRRRYGSEDYRRASGVMRDIFVKVVNEDYTAQLNAISIPLQLVWGSADSAAPVEQAQRAASMVKNSTLTVLEGRDHFGPIAMPAGLAAAVEEAVSRIDAADREEKG